MSITTVSVEDTFTIHPSDSRVYRVSLLPLEEIQDGETASSVGSPTVAVTAGSEGTAALTAASESVNSTAYTDPKTGDTVPANESVLVTLSTGTADIDYRVTLPVTLSGGSVVNAVLHVRCRDQ